MAQLDKFINGLQILSKYSNEFEVDYVPNSFPNGAPNNPSKMFIIVLIPFEGNDEILGYPVSEKDSVKLKEMNWWMEEEGEYWLRYV